jgi:hypothetical protein
MVWTEGMKEVLKTLATDGMSYGKIAKYMNGVFGTNLTKNSLVGMARRLGVPKREPIIKPTIVKRDSSVAITELQLGMCKWPLGEITDRPPYMYCGEPTKDFCSWCEKHREKAFGKSIYDNAKIVLRDW